MKKQASIDVKVNFRRKSINRSGNKVSSAGRRRGTDLHESSSQPFVDDPIKCPNQQHLSPISEIPSNSFDSPASGDEEEKKLSRENKQRRSSVCARSANRTCDRMYHSQACCCVFVHQQPPHNCSFKKLLAFIKMYKRNEFFSQLKLKALLWRMSEVKCRKCSETKTKPIWQRGSE